MRAAVLATKAVPKTSGLPGTLAVQADPFSESGTSGGIDLFSLIEIFKRRWLTLATVAALVMAAALAFLMVSPKLYTAAGLMYLDPRDNRVLGKETQPAGAGYDQGMVESQVRVITSPSVLKKVIDRLGLADIAEFGGSSSDLEKRKGAAADRLYKRISVLRADKTYIVDIKGSAGSPETARDIVNAVMDAYIEDQTEAAMDYSRRATEALNARLASLESEVRRADERVQRYRESKGLVGPSGGTITEQQLQALNQSLIAARARLATAQAKYEALKNGGADAVPDALNSPTVSSLRAQLSDARRREADLLAKYGERHPQIIAVRDEIASIERQINAEIARIRDSAKNEYEIARRDVATLERQLDELTGQDKLDTAAQIELRQLQREADTVRLLYEEVLKRAKETSEQEQLALSATRIKGRATLPSSSTSPPVMLILAGAIFLGLGLGAAAAIIRDGLDRRIRGASALRRAGFDVFASVPVAGARTVGPDGSYEYAVRLLRARLRDGLVRSHEASALLAPCGPADGAASLALNYALSIVSTGESVLLIDADSTSRSLTMIAAPDAAIGLAEVLSGVATLKAALVGEAETGIQFLPMAKTPLSRNLRLSQEAVSQLIASACTQFDYVLFVGAPLSEAPEASSIAACVSQIALVVRESVTTRDDIALCVRALRADPGKTCGVILNMASSGR